MSETGLDTLSREEKLALLSRLAREKREAAGGAGTYPLSFAQQRFWFLDQLEPGTYVNNMFRAWWLGGPLDAAALGRAFAELVRRHSTLRTRFPVADGEPRQLVEPPAAATDTFDVLAVEDLRGVPEAGRRQAAIERAEEVARTPFDLAAGPVFSAVLLVLGEADHALLFGLHHIAGDGWSLSLLVGELATLYNADVAGEAPSLPALTTTFGEHARWQRERLAGDALGSELAFWRERLEGAPPVLELPTDHPRRPVASPRGDMLWFDLDEPVVAALRAAAQEGKATLFMALFAVFQVLLWRYCGQRDFVVGLPVANRNRTELEGVVGCFANTLLARCKVEPGDAFTALLAAVRAEALAVFAHSDLPFEKLVEDLQPERNLSANPLFQVMFVLQSQGRTKTALAGIDGRPMSIERGLSKLDLSLDMVEVERGMAAFFEFSTDLFETATVGRMVGHFRNLAAGAAADPGRPLRELPLLSPDEREHLLSGLNQRAGSFPPPVPDLVAAQARRTPEAPAVLFGDRTLTYAQLVERANRLARVLRRLGVGPDVPVGVCVERSVEMPLALLAVLQAGGAWVPLEPLYPQERLTLLIQDTGMPVLLTQGKLLGVLPEAAYTGPRIVVMDEYDLSGEDPAPPDWEIHPESLAYVIYTSGSTGKPKGVGVPHRSLANHAVACSRRYGLGPDDRCLQFTSISFDITSEEIFPTWITGGAVVPRAPGLFPSLSELAALIERHGVTVANLPTAYWHEWTGEMHRAGTVPPPSLRLVVVGTEQALPERLAEWLEVVGTRVAWNNSFASTEATVTALVYEPTLEALPRARAGHRVPVGRTIANCCAYVLDADLQPLPLGVQGDVYIGGPNVSRGYLDWPDKTAASYLPDPFAAALGYGEGRRMYRQGDRGRWLASGDLELLGRADDQVKIRGFRIEPGEVETALARHPAVRDGVVLVKSGPDLGRRLVGYLTLVPGAVAGAEELRDWLRGILPDHMVPAALVVLDHLPLTHNGKVDRRALLAIETADEGAAPEAVYEQAPESPVADVIAGIWAALLSRERVGMHESFFDLGGHSLLAIQVVSRIREALGVEVPLRTLFEKPTVAGVAATAEALRRSAAGLVAPPVVPVPRGDPGGHLVCSFAQQRLWVLDKLLPGDPAYNTPVAVRLAGALDLPTLRTALGALIRRHEALRTVFAADALGQPRQVVVEASPAPPALPVIDLTGLAPAAREAEALARLLAESVLPFDLAKGPLLRLYAFRLAAAPEGVLLLYLNVHHIVSDGVSITLFLRELVALYTALSRGQESPLPELPVQYADFAAWQRSWLTGETLARQVDYWRRQLAGAPVVLELPTDRPRPAVQTSHGARRYLAIPAVLTRRLQTLGRERRATLFMTLQASFAALLGRYANQDDVLVGWPIAGRSRAELEGVFGFLANILVLRTRLDGEPGFTELLAAVREAALGAYAHQDLPFEQLVEELRPERHLAHNPIFQVFFVLHPPAAAAPPERALEVSVPSLDNRTTRGDLLLALSETQGELRGFFEYNTDLFDEATIVRVAGHFGNLLESLAAHPEAPVSALPVLAADERRQLLAEINATSAEFPRRAVHQLFEARAAAAPDAPALLFWEGGPGEALTYGELNRRANRLAHRLRAEGVGPGSRVGLCLERSPEMVAALLAVLKAGGAYVPLDPAYPAERIAYVLADCGARVLLTQPELRWSLPDHGLEVLEVEPGDGAFAQESAEDPPPLAGPEDLAYVIYTSGSTGKPKGVEVLHRGVVNFLTAMAREPGLAADDALLAVTTISFDIAALELYLPLAEGGRVILAGRGTASDGGLLKAALAASGATVMQATPATWRLLLAGGWQGAPRLKVLCGGEALPRDLAADLLARVGSLWNVYGPTETTVWSTVERVDLTGWPFGSMPIGRPVANTQVYLLDRHGEPVPPGVGGELLLGGDGVARGYLNRPALTAERFVPSPWGPPGSRLYKTGDVARLDASGKLVYLGRTDHQVKLRGYRIELGEVEAVLGRHPAVAACACAVREDTPGNPQLVAYCVAAPGQAANVGNLRAALREELPDYMIPGLFVRLDALPLTPNGKVDRKALPSPQGEALVRREYVAPEGPVQEQLAAIWAEVLKLPRVGTGDNFFELGGHSLLATSVLSRVAQAFGVELPLRAMFDHPTIAGLSETLVARELAGADSDLLAQLLADLEGEPSFS